MYKENCMDTLTIRQKLHEYINIADDEKIEAMYSSIENEVTERYEWWNDEELIAELDRRSADLKNGKDPGFTWEESRAQLLARLKNGK